jgi:hypothetical protein
MSLYFRYCLDSLYKVKNHFIKIHYHFIQIFSNWSYPKKPVYYERIKQKIIIIYCFTLF